MRPISKRRLLVEEQGHECRADMAWYRRIFGWFLKAVLVRIGGLRNALDLRVENVEVTFDDLPQGFDNCRILLLTDLHIDSVHDRGSYGETS